MTKEDIAITPLAIPMLSGPAPSPAIVLAGHAELAAPDRLYSLLAVVAASCT